MANRFPKLAPGALARLRRLSAEVRAHRFWVFTGATTLLLMAASFTFGYASLRRARQLEEQEKRVQSVLSRVDDWVAGFRPPTPAESLAWKNSERVMEELQEGAAEPVSVAAAITQRAQRLGIDAVDVRYNPTDSVAPPPARTVGGWTLEPQMPTLQVEFDATFPEVIEFIDALPPHVEVRNLSIARRPGGVRAALTVLAYRATRS
jgi:hypothetical protein